MKSFDFFFYFKISCDSRYEGEIRPNAAYDHFEILL